VATCQEVIHYPSEDYPCLCPGFTAGDAPNRCTCEHAQTSHVMLRVCRECACRAVIQ